MNTRTTLAQAQQLRNDSAAEALAAVLATRATVDEIVKEGGHLSEDEWLKLHELERRVGLRK